MTPAERLSDDFDHTFTAALVSLQAAIDRACRAVASQEDGADWSCQAAAAIRAGFEWAAVSPEAARVLTTEALAGGPDRIARYHRLLDDLAYRLAAGRELCPESAELPMITERALVGGLCSFVAQHLDTGRIDELPSLARDAIRFVLTPYVGQERARQVAEASVG